MTLKQLNLFSLSKTDLWEKRPTLSIFKGTFSLTAGDPTSFFASRVSLGLIFLSFLALVFAWRYLPPEVPLFYSLPYGESQLAGRLFLWLLPVTSLLVFCLNFQLAIKFFPEEKLLAQIALLTTSIVSFLSSVTLIKIIFLAT